MIYKVLQFWAKLNTDYPFTLKRDFFSKLTDVDFVYFLYLMIILQCLKEVIIVNHKIQGCVTFGQFGPGQLFGKIDYNYFCESTGPHHSELFKFKKSLAKIMRYKVLYFWSKSGPN